jgi:hypothetical protein
LLFGTILEHHSNGVWEVKRVLLSAKQQLTASISFSFHVPAFSTIHSRYLASTRKGHAEAVVEFTNVARKISSSEWRRRIATIFFASASESIVTNSFDMVEDNECVTTFGQISITLSYVFSILQLN